MYNCYLFTLWPEHVFFLRFKEIAGSLESAIADGLEATPGQSICFLLMWELMHHRDVWYFLFCTSVSLIFMIYIKLSLLREKQISTDIQSALCICERSRQQLPPAGDRGVVELCVQVLDGPGVPAPPHSSILETHSAAHLQILHLSYRGKAFLLEGIWVIIIELLFMSFFFFLAGSNKNIISRG